VTTIKGSAPVRVCDAGGWTDTWFAREGFVCSVAVAPGAEVVLELDNARGPTTIEIRSTGERITVARDGPVPGRYAWLEDAVVRNLPPDDRGARLRIATGVPEGSGTGTSAAVLVALLAVLRTAREEHFDPDSLAREAHAVETGLARQSGVQDQYAAAHGGANLMHVNPYPSATVRPIALDDDVVRELDERLLTVYLGRPHDSSRVHEQVIASLENDPGREAKLGALREAARAAADALEQGDIDGFGAVLVENTRVQAGLHSGLVNADAREVIQLAQQHGAAGYKVNGAGGEGGTVTVVGPADTQAQREMAAAIERVSKWRRLPLQFAHHGARVTIE
jgi:D-glycero-alpha-D-manno-heptose-7-phosphate kinase